MKRLCISYDEIIGFEINTLGCSKLVKGNLSCTFPSGVRFVRNLIFKMEKAEKRIKSLCSLLKRWHIRTIEYSVICDKVNVPLLKVIFRKKFAL